MSGTVVYSQVYQMVTEPESYLNKSVKMTGSFAAYEGDSRNYYACIIADASACCSQGIEFVLAEERSFPNEFPQLGETITVVGTFDLYYEGESSYCQLIDASIVA